MTEEEKVMAEEPVKHEAPKKRGGRPPKYETSYRQPGRPPRSPKKKVGRPLRYLVTVGLEKHVKEIAASEQLLVSDLQRLALYRFLEDWYKRHDQEIPEDIRNDTTFDALRGQGYV